jgi:hypothetical protein
LRSFPTPLAHTSAIPTGLANLRVAEWLAGGVSLPYQLATQYRIQPEVQLPSHRLVDLQMEKGSGKIWIAIIRQLHIKALLVNACFIFSS